MFDLFLLLVQLTIVLAAARCVGWLGARVGQPRVVGEIAAGIALGPSLLGMLAPAATLKLFPADGLLPLATLSQIGVLVFMFAVGLRLDIGALAGRVRSSIVISHASIVVPFALGASVAPFLYASLAGRGAGGGGVSLLPFTLFLGASMSVTAFPVLARILTERGLLATKLGSIALTCAAVDDVTAWCILAVVVSVARGESAASRVVAALLIVSALVLFLATIGRRALARLVEWRRRRQPRLAEEAVGIAIVFALLCALVTERAGIHALFGAFLAGAVVPRANGLAQQLADRIEPFVATVLLPIFFAFTGLRTNVALVNGMAMWGICALLIAIAIAGKLGGAAIAARVTGMSWRDGAAVGLLMNTRGLMELVVLNVGLELGVISQPLFTMLVLMALVTTAMASPLLALLSRQPSFGSLSITTADIT